LAWRDGLEEPGSKFHMAVLRRDGDPVAALPLYKARLQYRTLHRTYASEMDVVTSLDAEVAERLPEWLERLGVVHLYHLPDDSPIVSSLSSHRRWITRRRIRSPYIDLSGGIDQVRSGWSRDFQKNLDRRWRRLQEKGDLRYTDRHHPSELRTVLTEGLILEDAGWKGRKGVSVLRRPGYENFFRAVAEIAEDRGWLRLSALYLDDRMIAFCFDFSYGGRRHSLVSAYLEDPEIASISPGNALIRRVLEQSAAEGEATYEIGYGSTSWKYDWTSKERYVNDLVVVGSGLTGLAYGVMSRIRRR
jgi:CelD/BcsL family acetyltransferase involved in cellulose biosynthesis